jgi:hypothetical protein
MVSTSNPKYLTYFITNLILSIRGKINRNLANPFSVVIAGSTRFPLMVTLPQTARVSICSSLDNTVQYGQPESPFPPESPLVMDFVDFLSNLKFLLMTHFAE